MPPSGGRYSLGGNSGGISLSPSANVVESESNIGIFELQFDK